MSVPSPDPRQLTRFRALLQSVAEAPNRQQAHSLIQSLRHETHRLRGLAPPLVASALARLSRNAEAASGAVIEKSRRMSEMDASWELLMQLLTRL